MEAAGVALAAFPIVIQGIFNLVQAASTMKKFKHYHRELRRDTWLVENEYTAFQQSLENIVNYVGHSYEESQTLLKDPGGAAWKDPKFQKKLEAYLDTSYKAFVDTIDYLLEDLKKICKILDIDTDTRETQSVYFFRESINRFKHTFSQSVYQRIFDRIHSANDFLRRTTSQRRVTYLWRAQGQSRLKDAATARLRQHADSLYKSLAARERWRCPCRDQHLVNLCLETLESHLAVSKAEAIEFDVAIGPWVSTDAITSGSLALDNWQLLKVQSEECRKTIDFSRRLEQTDFHKVASKVRFELEEDVQTARKEQDRKQRVISDLCAALKASSTTTTTEDGYLGHLEAGEVASHQHGVFRATWPWKRGRFMEPISGLLLKLGAVDTAQQGASIFPRRSRLMVAAQLALSVLILDGSWLRGDWSLKDLVLIRGALQSKSPSGTIREEDVLLLPSDLGNSEPELHTIPSDPDDGRSKEVRCATLFALGLTLIELSLGARIEDLKRECDNNPDVIVSKRKTAFRLLPRVEEQDGDAYADVVERCLDCPFDVSRREVSFDNAKFRELVYESIVKPLKENAAVFKRG